MKTTYLLLLWLLPFATVQAGQTGNIPQRQYIAQLASQIHNVNSSHDESDTLDAWNSRLQNALESFGTQQKGFMNDDFTDWDDEGMATITSADRKLKIVYWNSQQGGTMRDYYALLFYQSGTQVKCHNLEATDIFSYHGIESYNRKDGTMAYLLLSIGHASNRDKVSAVAAVGLVNNKLVTNLKLFKAGSKMLSRISLALDMATVNSQDAFIFLGKDRNDLLIPVADADGKVTPDRFLKYRYNGDLFVFEKIITYKTK